MLIHKLYLKRFYLTLGNDKLKIKIIKNFWNKTYHKIFFLYTVYNHFKTQKKE